MLQIGNVTFVEFIPAGDRQAEIPQGALADLKEQVCRNRALIMALTELIAAVSRPVCAPVGNVCPARISDSGEPSQAPHTALETSPA
jgi:hypothetical protein